MALPRILDQLETAQLLRLRPEPEATYSFKHNLLQQAAYESLLVQDRRALHRAVGEILERLFTDRRQDVAEVLADHFDRAGDFPRSVGADEASGGRLPG